MENKLARLSRNTGAMRFFIPLGLILIVMGIFMFINTPDKYGETKGIVTNVTEHEDDKETVYDVDFEYTVDGVKYNSTFANLNENPTIGDEVTVFYDPADPQKTSNTKNTGMISIVMIVAGIAAMVLSILSGVKAFRKDKELDEKTKAAVGSDKMPVVAPQPKEQLTEYYISYDGNTLKPGYIVEDKARSVIFKAPMTKNAAIGNRIFTFTNKRTGSTAEHEVGHTTTTQYDNEFFSVNSWFKFDGENIWDVLHDRGIRIETDIHSIFPRTLYTISQNGRFFATLETSSKYVHEEDAKQHKVNIPVGRYYYRCWTNTTDIELMFLTIFAISETEQAIVE